jgi:hypothetical protein
MFEARFSNVDSVGRIPISEIVFQWFDYTLKDSSKPAVLKDKVNFEIMGANEWRSVPSLSKMSNDTLRLYLQPGYPKGKPGEGQIRPSFDPGKNGDGQYRKYIHNL